MSKPTWSPVGVCARALAVAVVFFLAIQLIAPALPPSTGTGQEAWPEQPRYRSDTRSSPLDRPDRPKPLQFIPCPQSVDLSDQARLGPPPASSWQIRPAKRPVSYWRLVPWLHHSRLIRHHRPPDRAPPDYTA